MDSWRDEDKKCLLTPTSLSSSGYAFAMQSESDLAKEPSIAASVGAISSSACASTQPTQYFFTSPLIYSEPALSSLDRGNAPVYKENMVHYAYSEATIPNVYAEDGNSATGSGSAPSADGGGGKRPSHHQQQSQPFSKVLSKGFTPKSSCFFSESQPSIITVMGSTTIPHKQSFSTREIREQHMQIQKKYRPSRKRHYTDPVDFEGILNIIGGCSWWQIWVYLLISLQQIPHAMFNLSVVYMMYQPDHWCQVPGMSNSSSAKQSNYSWSHIDTMSTSIVYPKTKNKQRDVLDFHSQCHYFDRGAERYEELRHMSLEDAQKSVNNENKSAPIVKCQKWEYDQDVMRNTIVTEWNLVCDDNFKRAHAHLFYSFGFLFGCLLGGFASDRFGRKPTVIGFGILSSMFGLILPYSTYFPMFLFIRFCGAVCNEAADLAAYVLCMEITGTRYRAMVGSLLQAPWAVGYATLALIAYFCKSWQYIQLITASLHTISICLICVLPESPRWLIVNNRVEEAERYIRRACRDPPFPFSLCNFAKSSLPCDLELVKHAEQRKWVKRHQRANILHLLKSRALCLRTAIICIVWIATALVYYGLVIALSDQSAPGRVLFSGNFFVNNAIAGAIELPTLLICVYLMAQMITLMGAAIFIFAAMSAILGKSPMVALSSMLLGKIFIQGAFNVLYIFTSEMYPTVIRNSAVGFCSMIARMGSGVSSYIAILSDVTLAIVPMIIFATFSLFAGILVMLLPETRDQPLPDTLQDAVTFLKNDRRYECYGFGGGGGGGGGNIPNNNYDPSKQSENDSTSNIVGGGTPALNTTATTTANEGGSSNDEQQLLKEGAALGDELGAGSGAGESNSISRKRSDTFNELPSIPEVPDHCENLLLLGSDPEQDSHSSATSGDSGGEGIDQLPGQGSTPTTGTARRRQRHRAGDGHRKVSNENLINNLSTTHDSLLKDLADIAIPDKLEEPFDP